MRKKTSEDFGMTDLEYQSIHKRFHRVNLMICILYIALYVFILITSWYLGFFREFFLTIQIIFISSTFFLIFFAFYMSFYHEGYKVYLSYVNYLRQYKLAIKSKERERKKTMNEVQLISPKFSQMKAFPLGLNKLYLLIGPFGSLFNKRWLEFVVVMIASILTLGVAWIIFAFKVNKIIVRRKVNEGYIPAREKDKAILEALMKGQEFRVDNMRLSRLGSVDGKINT